MPDEEKDIFRKLQLETIKSICIQEYEDGKIGEISLIQVKRES